MRRLYVSVIISLWPINSAVNRLLFSIFIDICRYERTHDVSLFFFNIGNATETSSLAQGFWDLFWLNIVLEAFRNVLSLSRRKSLCVLWALMSEQISMEYFPPGFHFNIFGGDVFNVDNPYLLSAQPKCNNPPWQFGTYPIPIMRHSVLRDNPRAFVESKSTCCRLRICLSEICS